MEKVKSRSLVQFTALDKFEGYCLIVKFVYVLQGVGTARTIEIVPRGRHVDEF